MKGIEGEKMITLCNIYTTTNSYAGSDWNFEKTSKYVFSNGQECIEAGYFIHYFKNGNSMEEMKHVIELPSSHGCLMRCGFCASSQIMNIRVLESEEIYEIFTYIFHYNKLENKKNILVSMKGIGDLYFTLDTVEKVLQKISYNYRDICFSVSSCYWTEEMLKKIEFLQTFINFRTIQVSYITHNVEKLKNVIPYYENIIYDVDAMIQIIKQSNIKEFKINYMLIKGLNDSDDDFAAFISRFEGIKNMIVIRISKVNETQASIKNGIIGASIDRMLEFKKQLLNQDYKAYTFYSYKDDNMNCGQLITEQSKTVDSITLDQFRQIKYEAIK